MGVKVRMKRNKIGTRYFGGTIDITDPCYNKGMWCRMDNVHIRPGEYDCIIWEQQNEYELNGKKNTYNTIGIIGIYLNGIVPSQDSIKRIGFVGVDAGLAGFFQNKPDFTKEQWADFCNQTRKGEAWITDLGFFSFSGGGDGEYDVFAYKVNEDIVALEIRFV